MLYRVIAPVGAGKRSFLFERAKEAFLQGKKVFFVVPEQESATVENQILTLLGPESNEGVEICNFSRLPNIVLREVGHLSKKSITEAEKEILLSECVEEEGERLSALGLKTDPDSIAELSAHLAELSRAGLSAKVLDQLSEMPSFSEELREKLCAEARLSAAYSEAIAASFSDPEEEAERLAEILNSHPFFAGSCILIDGFWDFTVPQENLIQKMMAQAESVYISFAADPNNPELFSLPLRSAGRLLRAAKEISCAAKDLFLPVPKEEGALAFLKENLLNGKAVYPASPEGLRLVASGSASEEALMVSSEILRLVRGGARWKEIAVLSRDGAGEELLLLTFEEKGIPAFLEEKKDLIRTPLAKTVLLGVRIALGKADEEDVRSYLKCGVLQGEEEELFLLEQYVATWSLSGKKMLSPEPFTMNPEGYFEMREAEKAALLRINAAKERYFAPLRRLSEALFARQAISEKISAIVEFLSCIGLEKKIGLAISSAKAEGDYEEAGRLLSEWNSFLEALSALGRALGEKECAPARFLDLIALALSRSLPGELPPSEDRVQVGRVSFSRPEGAKYVFLLGLNHGVFPQSEPILNFLAKKERAALAELGYSLPGGEENLSDEYFYFYLAAASAKKELILSFTTEENQTENATLSVIGKRVMALFPKLELEFFSSREAIPSTKEEAFSYYLRHLGEETKLQKALGKYFLSEPEWRERVLSAAAGKAALGERFFLSEEKPYAGRDVNMVYSRLEKYSLCRFSYFSRYLLEAKPKAKAEVGANIAGSFVHRVMELVLVSLASKKKELSSLSMAELKEEAEKAVREAVKELGEISDAKAEYLFSLLEKSCLLLLKHLQKEFSVSKFRPIFFEKSLDDLSGIYKIPLSDGKNLCLFGEIDRVDFYEKKSGEKYVRVVDYKTGGHDFSLTNVANGLDLQMLLYLFAIWNEGFEWEGQKIEPLPAGVIYLNGLEEAALCETAEEMEKIEADPFYSLSRKGLVVSDPELLSAQDPEGLGEFLPVAWGKARAGRANLVSMARLGKLKEKVERDFGRLAEELKSGRIEAEPLYSKGKQIDPCRYCEYLPLCKRKEENRRAYRSKVAMEELFGKEEA